MTVKGKSWSLLNRNEKLELLRSLSVEDLVELERLQRARPKLDPHEIIECRDSLFRFVEEGWRVLEGVELHKNWHHELICEYLMALFRGDYPNLLVNIQPRCLKSRICSVFFPCWVWLHKPHLRFLCISYASSLSNDHNYDRRILIQSSFYQQLGQDRPVTLMFGKNRISEFGNTHGGEMLSRGLDSAVTGKGGDMLIIDDPNDPERVESDTQRENNVKKCKAYMVTRKNYPDAPVLCIQQRTHRLDVSGWILEERGDEFEEVIIPGRATKETILYFPISKVYKKRIAGHLLHETRFNDKHEAEAKKLGPEIYAARFQQEPIPPGGGIIKASYFRRYTTLPAYPDFWVASWDTAQKKNETSKPWAGICAALYHGRIYVTDFHLNWYDYPQGERTLISLAEKWNLAGKPHALLIEDKSTGSTLIQRIRSEAHLAVLGLSVIGIQPNPKLDKIGRMTVEAPLIAGGRLYLPEIAPWLPDFEHHLTAFPQGEFMDPVDALSQLLMWVRTTGISYYDGDERE